MKDVEDLKKYLATPRDISKEPVEKQACHITLYFIGYVAAPLGIQKEVLQACRDAFNANRGKTEIEEAAVLKVLREFEKDKNFDESLQHHLGAS